MASLITGLGYVGSALAARLLAANQFVVGIESFFSSPRDPIVGLTRAKRFRLVEGSITDPAAIERAFEERPIDTVYHTAGQASSDPRAATLADTLSTNLLGTLAVIEAAAAHNVPRFVLSSSTRLYTIPLPTRISETTPIHAPDVVHGSQLLSEALLQTYCLQHPEWRVQAITARLGTIHGVGPVMKTDPRFLAVPQRFCLQAVRGETLQVNTGPSSMLAVIDVQDAVDGLIACASTAGLPPVVNLAKEIVSVLDIAQVVEYLGKLRGLSVKVDVQGAEPPLEQRSITSALASRGFEPRIDLVDSLAKVLDYYRVNPFANWPPPQ